MTREEALFKAKNVLDEATAYEDAVCYVTGDDREWFDMAIKALEQQPCDDCISRDEAIRVAEQGQIQGYEWQFKKLCNLLPVKPQPKTGRWVTVDKGLIVTSYKCSECGRTVRDDTGYDVTKDYPYCHCGARMIDEQESEG